MNREAERVAVGIVHGTHDVTAEFRQCVTRMMVREASVFPGRVIGEYDQHSSGAHVDTGRCQVVTSFLESPLKPDWLLFLDADATFPDDILDELLGVADANERPIIGALCFGVTPATNARGEVEKNSVGANKLSLYPTLYRFSASGITHRMLDYPENALVEVDATGCHCLLIHRKVFEDPRWDRRHPNIWFRSGTVIDHGEPGKIGEVSEDVYFCIKARSMGYPIFVNTAAKTGHVKTFIADEDMYLEQRKHDVKVQVSGSQVLSASTVIFVRAKNEPSRVAGFLKLWQKQKEDSEVIICLDDDDKDPEAYPKPDGVVYVSGPPGWSYDGLMVMTARRAKLKSICDFNLSFSFTAGWSKRRQQGMMTPEEVIERYDPRRRRVVLIPSRNAERCKPLVEELIRQGEFDRLVVAWNGSDAEFEQWLGDQPNISTMLCDSSDGIHRWWNHAITTPLEEEADLVFLNDDVKVGPHFVHRLCEGLKSYPKVAATCPNYDGRSMPGNAVVNDICAGRYDGTGGLSGFAFALSRDWLKESKYTFPEECKWWYGDNDLVMSIYKSGWIALMLADATCEHENDNSTWAAPEMVPILMQDQANFLARWPELRMIMDEAETEAQGV